MLPKWRSDGSLCPTCSGVGRGSDRYPAALCEACQASVVDVGGRSVQVFNEGFSGGLEIRNHDGQSEVSPEEIPLYCNGVECRAREHRFGGVVIQPVEAWHNESNRKQRHSITDSDFLDPRRCLLEPISEIWTAARLLSEAVRAHLSNERTCAEALIRESDIPAIAEWTNSVWGVRSEIIHRFRPVPSSPPKLAKEIRPRPRMPTFETCVRVKERDGLFCCLRDSGN